MKRYPPAKKKTPLIQNFKTTFYTKNAPLSSYSSCFDHIRLLGIYSPQLFLPLLASEILTHERRQERNRQ